MDTDEHRFRQHMSHVVASCHGLLWTPVPPAVTDRRYRANLPGCEPHGQILADGQPG